MINVKQRNFLLVIIIAFLVSFLTNNAIEYIVPNAIVTVVAVYILSSIIWSIFFKKKEFTSVMLWTIIMLGLPTILYQIFI
ncbi:MAG: hypothetical protein VX406_00345 [Bacteroidota bacterium]|nr:hypothetical protein [Bacteroidota bacterium]